MSCDRCPLDTLATHFPESTTELRIWHGKADQVDRVMLSLTHQGEQFAVTAGECREAMAKLLEQMDEKRGPQIGDCRVIIED